MTDMEVDTHENHEKSRKKRLGEELKSEQHKLTPLDRSTLKCYLNYSPVKGIERGPIRSKNLACMFVKESLWPDVTPTEKDIRT